MPLELISTPSPAEAWRPTLAAGTLWVADDDGPVAFLAATRLGDRLHIDEFDVAPAHQGRGLGRRILAEVIAWARAEGLAGLSLTTFANIPWNAPFYASVGFATLEDDLARDLEDKLAAETARGLADRVAMQLRL